jgi:hypothetical protein
VENGQTAEGVQADQVANTPGVLLRNGLIEC